MSQMLEGLQSAMSRVSGRALVFKRQKLTLAKIRPKRISCEVRVGGSHEVRMWWKHTQGSSVGLGSGAGTSDQASWTPYWSQLQLLGFPDDQIQLPLGISGDWFQAPQPQQMLKSLV